MLYVSLPPTPPLPPPNTTTTKLEKKKTSQNFYTTCERPYAPTTSVLSGCLFIRLPINSQMKFSRNYTLSRIFRAMGSTSGHIFRQIMMRTPLDDCFPHVETIHVLPPTRYVRGVVNARAMLMTFTTQRVTVLAHVYAIAAYTSLQV